MKSGVTKQVKKPQLSKVFSEAKGHMKLVVENRNYQDQLQPHYQLQWAGLTVTLISSLSVSVHMYVYVCVKKQVLYR